jgi:hypothetical protein
MSLADSSQDKSNDAEEDFFPLNFNDIGDGSCYSIKEWSPRGGNGGTDLGTEGPRTTINSFDVSQWLEETPRPIDLDAGLHLLVVENTSEENWNETPGTKFPLRRETLKRLLCKWGFPPLRELSHALYAGGSAAFEVGSNGRKKTSTTWPSL